MPSFYRRGNGGAERLALPSEVAQKRSLVESTHWFMELPLGGTAVLIGVHWGRWPGVDPSTVSGNSTVSDKLVHFSPTHLPFLRNSAQDHRS